MKKVSIIGIGRLGLCLGLNLEKSGYHITGVDINEKFISSLKDGSFISAETGVDEMLKKSKNFSFSTDIEEALTNDIIFIVVPTPSTEEWKYDHSNIEDVVNKLISFGKQKTKKHLIINCTTFPGYCEDLQSRVKEYNYQITYNPEFIAQGTILKDQLNADQVLIGEVDSTAGDILEEVYKDFMDIDPIFNRVSLTEAELVKLSINCFLTTKISYANMIGDIALKYNCNPDNVLNAIGSDDRIGNKYLKFGYGFGGPCFPRDNRALSRCAQDVGIDAVISRATDIMNDLHLKNQVKHFIETNDKDTPVKFDYLTYKKESISLEESQKLRFAIELIKNGYTIEVEDKRTQVIKELEKIFTS